MRETHNRGKDIFDLPLGQCDRGVLAGAVTVCLCNHHDQISISDLLQNKHPGTKSKYVRPVLETALYNNFNLA